MGLETFKKGAVLQEEEQKHAEPHAQWEALTNCIRSGASISSTAAVMREICDAVDHEVSKEVCSVDLLLACAMTAVAQTACVLIVHVRERICVQCAFSPNLNCIQQLLWTYVYDIVAPVRSIYRYLEGSKNLSSSQDHCLLQVCRRL